MFIIFCLSFLKGKEVACNISRLPPGSVVFEDIGTQVYKGQVLKPLERANPARHSNDPLPGRIRYRAPDHSEVEVPFGDKDQVIKKLWTRNYLSNKSNNSSYFGQVTIDFEIQNLYINEHCYCETEGRLYTSAW